MRDLIWHVGKGVVQGGRAAGAGPVDIGCAVTTAMQHIIQRGHGDQFALVMRTINAHRFAWTRSHQHAVEQYGMLLWMHARDQRGVIGPGDGRVAGNGAAEAGNSDRSDLRAIRDS